MKGRYYLGYYFMILEECKLEKLEENEVYIHEYLHFLQNIIFPYYINMSIDILKHVNKIKSLEEYQKEEMNEYQEGNSIDDVNNQNISRIENIEIDRENGEYYLQTEYGKHNVSVKDLLEYIVYNIQMNLKLDVENKKKHQLPDLPYRTIDKIFEYKNIEIEVLDKINIVEYCLYQKNPVDTLMRDFVFLEESINNKMNMVRNLDVVSTRRSAQKELYYILLDFYDKKAFPQINKYIKNVRRQYKKNNNLFGVNYIFTNIFQQGSQAAEVLKSIMETIGFPMIIRGDINNLSKIYQVKLNNDNVDFANLYIVYKLLDPENLSIKTCSIKSFCDKLSKYNTEFEPNCRENYMECKNCIFRDALNKLQISVK